MLGELFVFSQIRVVLAELPPLLQRFPGKGIAANAELPLRAALPGAAPGRVGGRQQPYPSLQISPRFAGERCKAELFGWGGPAGRRRQSSPRAAQSQSLRILLPVHSGQRCHKPEQLQQRCLQAMQCGSQGWQPAACKQHRCNQALLNENGLSGAQPSSVAPGRQTSRVLQDGVSTAGSKVLHFSC